MIKIPGPQPSTFRFKSPSVLSANDLDLGILTHDRAELLNAAKRLLAATARDALCCGAGTKKTQEDLRARVREIATHSEDNDVVLRKDRQELIMAGKALLVALERAQAVGPRQLQYSARTEKGRAALKSTIRDIINR